MKKKPPKSDAAIKAFSFFLAAAIGLSACEAPKPGHSSKGGKLDDKDKQVSSKESPATSGTTSEISGGSSAGKGNATADSGTAEPAKTASELDDLPQLSAARSVTISKLRDSMVICTVDGTPITVEGFKRDFRDRLLMLQTMLTQQPEKVNELLIRGRQMGVTLTDDERKKLLEAAKKKEALEGKDLSQYLKEKKITETQLNEQVLMLGLAFKTGTKMIETQLLNDMINRELLLEGARSAGYYRLSMNKYIEWKHGPKYAEQVKASNDTAEQIKDDFINRDMTILMMEQIAKQAVISEDVLKQTYENNKEQFRHGERLRLSQIVIAAPKFDAPPLLSIRSQILKQKPNISPEQLSQEEQILEVQQHNTAAELLARALKGEDFKTLADRYSSDDRARALKTGGDIGWLDPHANSLNADGSKSDVAMLTDAVKGLKVGQIVPELVQTRFGWHIVKLTDRQQDGYLPYEETKNALRQYLSGQNQQLARESWMKERRKTATIKLSDEFVRAAEKERKSASANAGDNPVNAQ